MDVSGINFDDDFSEQDSESKSEEKDGGTILKEYVVCVTVYACVRECVCARACT